MEEKKKILIPVMIFSIIDLVIAGLGLLAQMMVFVMYFYAGSGGGANTAVTNEAVLGIAGVLFFGAASWIIGGIAILMGLIMTIITIVKKQFITIWMPIVSIVLGIIPFAVLGILLLIIVA